MSGIAEHFDFSGDTVNVLMDVAIIYLTSILGWCLVLHAVYAPSSSILSAKVSGPIAGVMFLVGLFLSYRVAKRCGEYSKALAVFVVMNVAAGHTAGYFLGRWITLPTKDDESKMSVEQKKSYTKTSMLGTCISLGVGILLMIVVCLWTKSIVGSLEQGKMP